MKKMEPLVERREKLKVLRSMGPSESRPFNGRKKAKL